MTGELNFWDSQVWSFIISIGVVFAVLLFSNFLRRCIPFLRKSLIPSSVIGGFLLLLVNTLWKRFTGNAVIELLTLEQLTYHGLGLGVVALSLKVGDDKVRSQRQKGDIFLSGILTANTYLIQAIVGLGITTVLSFFLDNFPAAGIILPLGYGQGPGQAYNWGLTYMNQNGFENGSSFGLSIAACGFLAASLGGVIRLNIAKKKGEAKRVENADEAEDLTAEKVSSPDEIPLSESLDKLTVQFGIVFAVYAVAYAIMWALTTYVFDVQGGFFQGTIKPLVWGFNFLFGMLCATIYKVIMKGFKKAKIVKREYTNDFFMTRISGLFFDLMVVASIGAIDLSAFTYKEFLIPLISICVVGGLITYWYVDVACKKLFAGYKHEQFLAFYGMLTGTASTGFILLREIDPQYETPAADNLIKENLWAVIFGAPVLLILSYVPSQGVTSCLITLGLVAVIFAVYNIILYARTFKKKKNTQD